MRRTRYYSMDDAINADTKSKTTLIISNEYEKKRGGIGRYFTLFPGFKTFMKERSHYPHCHEIIIDHKDAVPNLQGRLVFDFDISNDYVLPKGFKKQVEKTIRRVTRKYFTDIDTDLFDYVWSSSPHDNKTSKHLTVKNLYLEEWIVMSSTFYRLFGKMWDKRYDWILAKDLVDGQIARKKAALRMVGSSKIGGNCLTLDNPDHKLTDSLIRIYYENRRKEEQMVRKSQMIPKVLQSLEKKSERGECRVIDLTQTFIDKEMFHKDIYNRALDMLEQICPSTFDMRVIKGDKIMLNRTRAGKCVASNKYHEHEHAYLWISDCADKYWVFFRCFRNCGVQKYRKLGSINPFTNAIEIWHRDTDKFNLA